jgi:hypothetical protein
MIPDVLSMIDTSNIIVVLCGCEIGNIGITHWATLRRLRL